MIRVVKMDPSSYRGAGPSLVIERRWRSWQLAFAIPFCLFWDGVLVTLLVVGARDFPPLLLGHVGFGLWISYATLCALVNRTRIVVENATVNSRHGPLPWPGNCTIAVVDIARLHREVHRGKRGPTYSVSAEMKSGTRRRLTGKLPHEDARELGQALADHLDLPCELADGVPRP